MSQEMIDLYKKLNTNEKRNELSSLIVKLDQLINQLMLQSNINIKNDSVKNYDSNDQALKTEDEMLLFFYDDVWKLKNKVLRLLIEKSKEV